MSSTYISVELRNLLGEVARNCCEYCQPQGLIIGMPLEVKHIIPISMQGSSDFQNTCLACPSCNRHKGIRINFPDRETGIVATLFHPREQLWSEHFQWAEGGLFIVGLTPTGRATVEALNMNNPYVVRARRIWISQGWHPPQI